MLAFKKQKIISYIIIYNKLLIEDIAFLIIIRY